MSNEISIAIVGGGVVGCAVAWELSRHYDGIFVFEKNPGITQGENQSSRNSGVIHSGIYYDQKTRPLKAELCVKGNRFLYDFCDRHEVPALKTGKLMVATNGYEDNVLDIYLERARQNRVPGVKKISGAKVKKLEPNVKAISALFVPTAGIVEPTTLTYRLYTLASGEGVQFMTATEVTGIEPEDDLLRLTIRYRDGHEDQVRTGVVINSGGVDADLLARLFNPDSPFELDPVRGESYKFYGHKRPELEVRGMNIYPTPQSVVTPYGQHFTVGVHLTPAFEDISFPPSLGTTVTIGPKLIPVEDRQARAGKPVEANVFSEKIRSFFPDIKDEDLIWHQAGLQARLKDNPDFIIEADADNPHFINLLGIDSPGLTACLSIARRVKEIIVTSNE